MTNGKSITVTVIYTKKIMSAAVRTFIWKRGIVDQKGLWITETMMAAILAGYLWCDVHNGLVVALGVFILFPPVLVASAWIMHYRFKVRIYKRMASYWGNFLISDNCLKIETEQGSMKIEWSDICEIWERPDYWMIFTAPNQFITLPVASVSSVALVFLRTNIRTSNASVKPL